MLTENLKSGLQLALNYGCIKRTGYGTTAQPCCQFLLVDNCGIAT